MTPRSVLITGASSGLGRGLSLHYARAGATVHAVARRNAELQSLVAEAPDGRIRPVVLDVTESEKLVDAIRAAESASRGALDLVIANAGVGGTNSARKIDWTAVKKTFEVNTTAAAITIAAALPAMVARDKGHVVAVSSLAAFRGMPGHAAYCGSKAALQVFMESVRVDLRGTGVRATTILPGFVKTAMTAKNRFRMPFLMELDAAVALMARGIERGKPIIAYPLPMAAMVRSLGALPRSIYEPLAGRTRVS